MSAIRSVWWRQLHFLFSNPLSYVFMLSFCLIAASIQFMPIAFYSRNICDLQPLVEYMPWLAAVFLPALAMSSWAGERELHTDEVLLTLPIKTTEIMLGKWLGLCTYWFCALIASASNVLILLFIGSPDIGLLCAQYLSWLCLGMMLSGIALYASCLVSYPPAAFILGCLFCTALVAILESMNWGEHFQRGRLHLSSFLLSAFVCFSSIALCILHINSLRWRKQDGKTIARQLVIVFCAALLLLNTYFISQRYTSALDITDEQLSSLSQPSYDVLQQIDQDIHIHAFIHHELPNPYHIKGEELQDLLSGIKSLNLPNIHIHIRHPKDPLDLIAEEAQKHFGISAKRVNSQDMIGGQELDIFLGIALHSGAKKQIIPFLDTGMSAEFHIIRAIHTLNKKQLPRLGIVANNFPLLAHHDYRTDRMRPESPIVREWRKQYQVSEVFLNERFDFQTDALVVPMPSSLNQDEINVLQQYLQQGGRALLLEDPAPMWSQVELAASLTRQQFYLSRGLPYPENIKEKGDIGSFYQSLGIYIPLDRIIWSDDNPSFRLRQMWPPSIVWVRNSEQAISPHLCTTGIDNVLLPFPGSILAMPGASTQIKPLLNTARTAAWGKHKLSDYIRHTEGRGFTQHKPQRYSAASEPYAILAAEIEGKINGGDKAAKIIVITDCDFIHDQFYELYTKAQPEFHDDDLSIVRRLQNFQFINNCLDVLNNDVSLLPIRTRQLRYRSLQFIENVQRQKEKYKQQVFELTRDNTLAEQEKAKAFQEKLLQDIQARDDLNDTGKQQLYQSQLEAGKASFEETMIAIKRQEAEQFKQAEIRYRRAIDDILRQIRQYAIGIPGCILGALALFVWLLRRFQERSIVPGQRLRDNGHG